MTELVHLLRPTNAKDTTGQEIATWTKYLSIMSRVTPISGRELINSLLLQSEVSYKLNFPYYPAVESDHRVLIPLDHTTIAEALDDSEVGVDVADYTAFSLKGLDFYVLVDSEFMKVTSGQGTSTLTVTRGQLGTSAAAHTTGKVIVNFAQLEIKNVVNVNQARVETELLCGHLGNFNA